MKTLCIAAAVLALAAGLSGAEPAEPMPDISLPVPRMAGGKPLMETLKARQSARAFRAKPLPLQVVSDLLFCASEGLVTVVRGLVDRDALARALNLPAERKIVLAQTVGYAATDAQ